MSNFSYGLLAIYGGLFVFAILLDYTIMWIRDRRYKAEINKVLEQQGSTDIVINNSESLMRLSNRATRHMEYDLQYVNRSGEKHIRHVARDQDGTLFWDRPIHAADKIQKSQNDEQIISELDAEIKRLQRKLTAHQNNQLL